MNSRIKQLDEASTDVEKHMYTNDVSNLEIPTCVPGWLDRVKKIKEDAQNIPSTGTGCFEMKLRYRVGRNAFKIEEGIKSLIEENSKISWSDARKPLGKVTSKIASGSAPLDGDAQNDFKSRKESFKKAFTSLQQDHTSKVIALCGMGGADSEVGDIANYGDG
ncbi:hypothetical protein L2E82_36305 [Cichorium intybus]|uniref:Uncharacterized protein n=1 Tax=Cichorium intybus TaxID=13427 RepID=A0ACB9BRJ6_CICIN|nr:hypothetical protein L2E82_36305 [Cichorium intybus]